MNDKEERDKKIYKTVSKIIYKKVGDCCGK